MSPPYTAASTSRTQTSSLTRISIPATETLTGLNTVCVLLRRPSAERAPRVRAGRPIADLLRVMRKKVIWLGFAALGIVVEL
ncbi:hypothetical protein L249_6165 [Ophiocordyceps polyrhachis-furcata BCC 54312]|uniref:Uncharacterized protein n=1 Tax=Ophiocordyceps polyrhachis-furcata BCC 54312 TaxID=1330021 RepID=A0A367LJ15_9HYPO|nr:hypothetical protein L249_6165 [Ophiocordyceps polyrhachis-furcata BCC 54312]